MAEHRETTDPLDAYLRFEQQAAADGALAAEPRTAESPFTGADAAAHERIAARLAELRPELETLVRELHADPEIGFEEHRSVQRIAALLAAHGFDAEIGAYGLPTAFRVTTGAADGPHFAIVAEYDALPEIGHACGHNIIAGIALGAFLSAAEVLPEGTRLSLIGTPAEEGGGGKELVLRAGGFDDVDAAGMVHPSVGDQVSPIYGSGTTGVRRVAVTYRGRAAHAAAAPQLGLNALDAVVTAYQSVAQLRQHILPVDRVHGIITDGGAAANVIPEHASAEFLIRSTETETLNVLTDRVVEILEAAALSTGTRAEIDLDFAPPYLPVRNNVSLVKHWARHLTARGRTVPLVAEVQRQGGPSTDMGNVTRAIPAIHPALGLGGDPAIAPHHAAFAATTIEDPAFVALIDAAAALAGTAADFLADPELRAAVRSEFEGQVSA